MLGFSIGLRTLRAAQVSMDLVGQNIANASTPGYSRRLVALGATEPWFGGRHALGTGVRVNELRRVHDGLLELRLRDQRQVLGQLEASGSLLRQLEGFFQEPSESGLAARLDELWNGFSDASRSGDDTTSRDALVQSGLSLGARFRQVAAQVDSVGSEARGGVDAAVAVVNGLLSEVASVNDRIMQSSSFGAAPSDLLDARDRLVQELSDWVDPQAIDRPDGTVDVLLDGMQLVSGSTARPLMTRQPADGTIAVVMRDGGHELDMTGGRLKGYLDLARLAVPRRQSELDALARTLLYEVNKRHATSVAAGGPWSQLTSAVTIGAADRDLPLAELDLPFPVKEGRLAVNVVDAQTGSVTQHFLAIDPQTTTLEDLATQLDGLPHVAASLDSVGRLRVAAESGYGFDFSSRLDVDPDDAGSFGSDRATLTTAAEPFALVNGATLSLAVDGGAPVTVTFNAASFADITQATAAEVAAVMAAQVPGLSAVAQDGRLVLQSGTSGTSGSLAITGASSNALFAVGASDVGSDTAVAVRLSGSPTDGHAGHYTIRALGDGVIGLTPGLTAGLFDATGAQLATFDVGDGYVPGDPIELLPGVSLSLTAGTVTASAGDVFEFDLVDEGDSSDVLVALQLGAFFTGRGAADLDVNGEIVADPRRVAGSRTGEAGDTSAFLDLAGLRDLALGSLSGRTLQQSYGEMVASVGFDVRTNDTATSAQGQLLASLESRREEISGVNTDEEMVRLLEYQHLYQAAGRYLQSVNAMTEELFQLI
jgi:flagellar hook-associated protein 1